MKKTILITGCSTGFGREAALRFARRGDRVYATMRGIHGKNAAHAADLQSQARAGKLDLRVLELDVTDAASVAAAAALVERESGAPDVIINNAGVMYGGITEAFDDREFAHQLDVNVVGVHRVTRALLPVMRKAGKGLIVNVSSVAGRIAAPAFGIYCASKWALEGYSACLRSELASSGIDVVLVEPGPFKTELFGQSPKPKDADQRAPTYPPALLAGIDAMGQMFAKVFEDPTAPTDAGLVVDLFVALADQAPGTRALRTAVGLDFGVNAFNQQAVAFDASVLEGMGLTAVAKLRG